MKLIAELSNEKYEINLKQEGENLFAEIEGRAYELEAHEVEPNVYLLKHENRIYQIFVSPRKDANEPFSVNLGMQSFSVKIFDPKRLRSASGAAESADGAAEIKTAMPGKVVRVLVEQGAQVQIGDGILIVEAMKMQNELKSPKDGTVKEIRAESGATVSAGDVLAVIE